MIELTWIGPRREFTCETIEQDDPEPVLKRLRLDQRSDGVLFYLQWEVNPPSYKNVTATALESWQAERAKSRELRWKSFLYEPIAPELGRELGWLKNNTGLSDRWTEVSE